MKIHIRNVVLGDRRREASDLYTAAFTPLDALTVQRHLMEPEEFDGLMADPTFLKYLAVDDETLIGLAVYTNDLRAYPLISWRYFQRRYPEQFEADRVWYCVFVGVHPDHQHGGAFPALVEAMYHDAAKDGGIIALDLCRYNDRVRHMGRIIPRMMERLDPDMQYEAADTQTFYIYRPGLGVAP